VEVQNAAVHLRVETQAEIDSIQIRPVSTPGWRRSIHVWSRDRSPDVAAFMPTGRARDGHHYVADLKRLGKY
jgi:hypothetical protein